MRALYTIAYPQLAAGAGAFIDRLRAEHDPQHRIVGAHFTLLFGSAAVDETSYTAHVHEVARNACTLDFTCRRAMLAPDATKAMTHVYLVPDEGFGALAQLHDRLYGDVMAAQRRLDLAYIPHITVATLADPRAAQALCDELNRAGVDVAGQLHRLSIGTLQDGAFVDLSHHALGSD